MFCLMTLDEDVQDGRLVSYFGDFTIWQNGVKRYIKFQFV